MNETTAERIKKLRVTKGISMAEISKSLGISEGHYRRLEEDSRVGYSPEEMRGIADYHKVSTDYLLVRTERKRDLSYLSEEQWAIVEQALAGIHNSDITY